MLTIVKQEMKNGLKNPLLWIGFIIVLIGLYQILSPAFTLHYFRSEKELEEVQALMKEENMGDADVIYGYIPATEEDQREEGYRNIRQVLVESYEYSEEEAGEILDELRKMDMDEAELSQYMEEKYSFYGVNYYFYNNRYRKGTLDEVNGYIEDRLARHPFSWYFARKFADFAGLFMVFFASVFLAFSYIRDTKRDTWELLHTKPVPAAAYIGGKVLGGFLVMLCVLAVLCTWFTVLCTLTGRREGLPVRPADIPAAALCYVVPNLFMVVCVYTFAAMVFKNPLPAMPLLFLYVIYSNMGSVGPDGRFGYYGRPLAIMVRFPGLLLDVEPPPMAIENQVFLLAAAFLLMAVSAAIWRRRRIY